MAPFIEKETGRILPRGKTELAKDVYLIHPHNRPEDEALIALENCGKFRPATVDIVGREGEGKEIFINPPSRVEPVVLTWEPTIEVKAKRIIEERRFERYFPLTNRFYDFTEKKVGNLKGWEYSTVSTLLGFPLMGAAVTDAFLTAPRRVSDLLTKYWQSEKAKITTELEGKKS